MDQKKGQAMPVYRKIDFPGTHDLVELIEIVLLKEPLLIVCE